MKRASPLAIPTWRNRVKELRYVAPRELADHPLQWREHPDQQRSAVRGVLEEVGIAGALLAYVSPATGKLTSIDGHLRKSLGDTPWPTLILDVSDEEAALLLATHDPLAALAESNKEQLTALLHTVQSGDPSVQQMLADLAEHEGVVAFGTNGALPETEDVAPQMDRAEELREQWGVDVGQLWTLGNHRLICGDCTNQALTETLLEDAEVEAVITDPPYGIDWDTDYTRFTNNFAPQVRHRPITNDLKPFDPRPWLDYPKVILWGANWYCQHIPLGSWLVWDKRHTTGSAILSDAELGWMKGKRGVSLYAETLQGAIRTERAMHPTQKPVGLMRWCMEKAEVEHMVLDPYSGSGTTLIACENLGHICYACEIDPGYVAVTLQRYADLTGDTPRLVAP